MIEDDLISIIVPVFNNEMTIRRCLESLLGQSYKHLEIIVVYLAGGDETQKILESFHDPRIKVVEQEQRTGPGGARNIGLENAQGKFLGFCDVDDWVDSDFYEALYSALLKKGADVAIAEMVTSSTKDITGHRQERIFSNFQSKLQTQQNGAVFNKLFRSDIIQKHNIRFPEGLYWEDNPWLLQVLYWAGDVCTVTGVYYHYLPSAKNAKQLKCLEKDVLPIAQQMIAFVEKNELSPQEREQVENFILRSFAERTVSKKKDIYEEFKKIFKNHLVLTKLQQRYRRRNIFRFSVSKKYIVLLGHRFPKKG